MPRHSQRSRNSNNKPRKNNKAEEEEEEEDENNNNNETPTKTEPSQSREDEEVNTFPAFSIEYKRSRNFDITVFTLNNSKNSSHPSHHHQKENVNENDLVEDKAQQASKRQRTEETESSLPENAMKIATITAGLTPGIATSEANKLRNPVSDSSAYRDYSPVPLHIHDYLKSLDTLQQQIRLKNYLIHKNELSFILSHLPMTQKIIPQILAKSIWSLFYNNKSLSSSSSSSFHSSILSIPAIKKEDEEEEEEIGDEGKQPTMLKELRKEQKEKDDDEEGEEEQQQGQPDKPAQQLPPPPPPAQLNLEEMLGLVKEYLIDIDLYRSLLHLIEKTQASFASFTEEKKKKAQQDSSLILMLTLEAIGKVLRNYHEFYDILIEIKLKCGQELNLLRLMNK